MKLLAKKITSLFMGLTLVGTILLRATSDQYLPSQSAFANQPNLIWYICIHVGMIMTFFTLNSANKDKPVYGLTSFASLLVLALDMYGFSALHNVFTASLFVLASYCLVIYSSPVLRRAYFKMSLALGAVFGLEVVFRDLLPIDVYQIESIIQWTFSIMLSINMYFFQKNT